MTGVATTDRRLRPWGWCVFAAWAVGGAALVAVGWEVAAFLADPMSAFRPCPPPPWWDPAELATRYGEYLPVWTIGYAAAGAWAFRGRRALAGWLAAAAVVGVVVGGLVHMRL